MQIKLIFTRKIFFAGKEEFLELGNGLKIEKLKETFSDLKVRFENRLILLLNFATLHLRMIAPSSRPDFVSLTTFMELNKKRTQGTKL